MAEKGRNVVQAPRGLAFAQIVLGLGGLFIGTGEFASMGLLPDMAASTHVSMPQAGNLISAYALGVVLGSPLLAVLTARMERRRVLIILAAIVFVGNVASAIVPGFFGLGVALVPALQARLMDVAQDAQALAAAMNHSAFNLSNAIGAWTGGMAISAGLGWPSTGLVAGGLAIGGLAMMILSCAVARMGNTFSNKTMGF